jgi:hypothetical protein
MQEKSLSVHGDFGDFRVVLDVNYQKSHLGLHFPEAWVGVGVERVGVGGGRVRPAASQSEI